MRSFLFIFLFCLACKKNESLEKIPPVGMAGTQKIAGHKVYEGRIDELIERDQFSYIRLGENWFAIISRSLKVGQRVKIEEQAVFHDFHSKTLGRVFPQIIFGKPLSLKPVGGLKPVQPH